MFTRDLRGYTTQLQLCLDLTPLGKGKLLPSEVRLDLPVLWPAGTEPWGHTGAETEVFISFKTFAELSLPSLISGGPGTARDRGTFPGHQLGGTLSPSKCRGHL